MSIEIKVYGTTADEALTELKTFSAGLLECTARTSATHADVDSGYAEAVQTEDHQEGETEEQHGESVKRKRRTKAEMEAARAAEANEAHAEPVVGVDLGAGDIEVKQTPPAEEGRLTGAEDPFPPSVDLKAAVPIGEITFEAEFEKWKTAEDGFGAWRARPQKENAEPDEHTFLQHQLTLWIEKPGVGMDAAREFMVANGYGAVRKIKPEERTAFLTAVYGKLGE